MQRKKKQDLIKLTKSCYFTRCLTPVCILLLTCFRLMEGIATLFRPETAVERLLHLFVIIIFINLQSDLSQDRLFQSLILIL